MKISEIGLHGGLVLKLATRCSTSSSLLALVLPRVISTSNLIFVTWILASCLSTLIIMKLIVAFCFANRCPGPCSACDLALCAACNAIWCSTKGRGRKKFLVLAYSFLFGGYPQRGGGGLRKKFAPKIFFDPKTRIFLNSTPSVWVWKVQEGYFSTVSLANWGFICLLYLLQVVFEILPGKMADCMEFQDYL